MKSVEKIESRVPTLVRRKRVAAYARVSMDSERMSHSLSAQISFYSEFIQKNPEWEYAGVYADYGISGTGTKNRDEFNRMLADCEAGKIDIVLTKSIQRFARNTVDLLETVRHLRELGIEVRFEKENINSMSGDGELMMTILASFAQEESRSISDNLKWSIRKRMQQGVPHCRFSVYGYVWEEDHLVVVPDEAAVVRRIFQNFLDGKSRLETERELEAEGIRTRQGCVMRDSNIRKILTNVIYTGNLLLQKVFIDDPITKKKKKNNGELPQYWVENTHEPIIDMKTFQYVQEEMARRRELGALANKNASCFTGKIKCPCCGVNYTHAIRPAKNGNGRKIESWVCSVKFKAGGPCPIGGTINQDNMKKVLAETLGTEKFDEELFRREIDTIVVPERYTLEIHFNDGKVVTKKCPNTGNQDRWTKENREWLSQYERSHVAHRDGVTAFTTKIKCDQCGCNFRGQLVKKKDGSSVKYWRCPAKARTCGTTGLRDDFLKELSAEVLGLESFDADVFLEKIDHISVLAGNELVFHFKDGSSVSLGKTKPKRVQPPWTDEHRIRHAQVMQDFYTEERRMQMSEHMKQLRKERGKNWLKKK